MAKHIIRYPDCPVCGSETKERSKEMENGAIAHWWHCSKCGANSPKCISPIEAHDMAVEWSERRTVCH